VGTDPGEVAVAPGALLRSWNEGGRPYFHYATSAPIDVEWAFFSAPYTIRQVRWNDVSISVFHHPTHRSHVDRMLRSAQASLGFYTREFGPYPYRHLTLVEHPLASGTGAHADPGIISYGQGFADWAPRTDRSLDFPYAVMGHEMGHQWGLPYAMVEGLPFLSEGLAWYFSMQMVKETRGEDQLRGLMRFMREPYPHRPIRRGEPLLRALDPYLSYRKGPFAMQALSEYLGAHRVNGAIRRLIEAHDAPGAPGATTLDLYRELQAVTPDSLRYLLHDLFEVNAYWELETTRAAARPAEGGAWQVTLEVRARKLVYDTAGVRSEMAMNEWLPVGVFAPAPDGAAELSAPLYLRMHRIRSGAQTITTTVPRRPELAGIDPFHLLDLEEGEDDDNVAGVQIGG
jgi:ABC-2 type transport system permease protein